jgi:aspartate aminotransferase
MISRRVADALEASSWIRKMFEEGDRLRVEHGADQVADLSLGNPILEPPPEAIAVLRRLIEENRPGVHRYMPNAGLLSTRTAVARHLESKTQIAYGPEHVVMSVGAGGALNATLKALLDPQDEVIALRPYFVEYGFYVKNHGGELVTADTDTAFRPDPDALEAAITARTRAVIINSPNNPTGVTYSADDIAAIAEVLDRANSRYGRPIYLISDEPYRAIVYDKVSVPWPARLYSNTIHITSFSKDLSLAGERIGYVAVSPRCEDASNLIAAIVFTTRVLGFVNAPALQQRWIEGLLDVEVDYSSYAEKRAVLLKGLDDSGYDVVRPTGAFYVFPKVPRADADDIAFAKQCVEERLLVVPGTGFGLSGHVRLSYAVPDRDIELAVAALARLNAHPR